MKNELGVIAAFIAVVCIIAAAVCIVDPKKDAPALEVAVIDESSGNLRLDVTLEEMESIGAYFGCDLDVAYGGSKHVTAVFSEVKHGIPRYGAGVRYSDGDGRIWLGISGGDFAEESGLVKGDTVTLKVMGDDIFYKLVPNYRAGSTDKRADYDDDQSFGNYRELDGGGLKDGSFYRSSNPWNYLSERAQYCDDYYRGIGVENLICFDLSMDHVQERCKELPNAYATFLYKQGRVHQKQLQSDIFSDPEQTRFVLESLMDTEGSVGMFCKYGKDRTGAYCAMIEGLAGASFKEVREDFMESFCNYYHFEKDSPEYEALAHGYIDRVLYIFQHPEYVGNYLDVDWSKMDFRNYDPEEVMTDYLADSVGLSSEFIGSVKERITA